jgi:hypothetical protein
MRKSYRGPSIDASCNISLHLAKRFQRRRFKCEKLTDRLQMPSDDKSPHSLWPGELKTLRSKLIYYIKLILVM